MAPATCKRTLPARKIRKILEIRIFTKSTGKDVKQKWTSIGNLIQQIIRRVDLSDFLLFMKLCRAFLRAERGKMPQEKSVFKYNYLISPRGRNKMHHLLLSGLIFNLLAFPPHLHK